MIQSNIVEKNFSPAEGAMEILTATITPTKPDAQDAKRTLISGKLGRFASYLSFPNQGSVVLDYLKLILGFNFVLLFREHS